MPACSFFRRTSRSFTIVLITSAFLRFAQSAYTNLLLRLPAFGESVVSPHMGRFVSLQPRTESASWIIVPFGQVVHYAFAVIHYCPHYFGVPSLCSVSLHKIRFLDYRRSEKAWFLLTWGVSFHFSPARNPLYSDFDFSSVQKSVVQCVQHSLCSIINLQFLEDIVYVCFYCCF